MPVDAFTLESEHRPGSSAQAWGRRSAGHSPRDILPWRQYAMHAQRMLMLANKQIIFYKHEMKTSGRHWYLCRFACLQTHLSSGEQKEDRDLSVFLIPEWSKGCLLGFFWLKDPWRGNPNIGLPCEPATGSQARSQVNGLQGRRGLDPSIRQSITEHR